eukprot:SAG31_NODE_3014_length_4786_cov_9.641135_10_plen_70_part_00
MAMAATEVEAQDMIRLMLQFCKENSLSRTFKTLQEESGTHLNTVDSVDNFVAGEHEISTMSPSICTKFI